MNKYFGRIERIPAICIPFCISILAKSYEGSKLTISHFLMISIKTVDTSYILQYMLKSNVR